MSNTIPNYIIEQIEQNVKDRQHAIDVAVGKLEEAQANFKLEILAINGIHHVSPKRVSHAISADPTVAQYA